MSETEEKITQELKTLVADLSTLSDEVKLKVHLGGLEAKETWTKLEPKLQQLRQKAAAAKGNAVRELERSARELKEEVHDLKTLLGL